MESNVRLELIDALTDVGSALPCHPLAMISYEINPTQQRLHIRLSGWLTSEEIRGAIEDITADPRFDARFSALIDLSELTRVPSVAELRDIATVIRAAAQPTKARRALVTDSGVFFNLAELFATFVANAGTRYRVFRQVADAEAWLALPGDDEMPLRDETGG